ncbi:hypothetical protein L5515_001316 [Caenorhabditis briggsae]|uniref:Uncharacterized protein n=1 Tax=Caenorhabditis briggsae TaxID=6238 RepID=A0AAE9E4I8_CAEBR|nr:hypothetical protein L5515_001316 [Caenorhabditis briggsae]
MRLLHCSTFLIPLFSTIVVVFASDESDVEVKPALSPCKRINPCGATISTYPLLEPDAEESSGFGSGAAPPVYDEILTHEIYDLNATPELQNSTLCSCPGDSTCDFESDSNVVKVDYHVTLRFCSLENISTVCKRHDVNVRVIGAAQASGDSVQDVSTAMMFCNCPNGFSRQPVEVWSGQDISLNYKCL